MASNRGRTGKQYHQRIADLKASGAPCCFCGEPIDPTLRSPHPYSWSLEHTVIPVKDMAPGDPAMWAEWNTDSAHRRCNVIDGNLARKEDRCTPQRRPLSPNW